MSHRLTERELAVQLEQAVATVIEESARKDARIAALEQENALLIALLTQVRDGLKAFPCLGK